MKTTLSVFFAAALSALAQFPDFTPPTPMIGAAMANNTEAVKRLLDSGVKPDDGRFMGGRTPLFFAIMNRNAAAVDALIAKGADIHFADDSGSTPLMWAAFDENGEPALVNRLIALGADPNVKNKAGETALTWALRRGYTPVVEALKKAGASDKEMVKQSVEKALALVQKSGPQFMKVSGCVSCHNNQLPQMAYTAARVRGFAVDKESAEYNVKAAIAMFRPMLPAARAGKLTIPDPAISVSYVLVGLASENYPADEITEAMAEIVSRQQLPDGRFLAFSARPPIESSEVTATALSLRALQVYGKDAAPRIERARAWLATASPRTTEERVMQLLGLSWSKGSAETMKKAAQTLIAHQRQDGGWAQLAALESDAYATGQAMVALMTAGQISTSDAAWQRGMAFLLRTQLDDGSWFVRTRTFPFQPYKESGFPHARHQWISAAGTSWAAWALSLSQPVRTPESGPRVTNAMAIE
jgi:hypothetical protein